MLHENDANITPDQPAGEQPTPETVNDQPAESVTDVTPAPDQPKQKPEIDPVFEYLMWQTAQQRQKDETVRRDPWVRLTMVEVIHDLKFMLMDRAAEMLSRQGKPSTGHFEIDKAAEILLWQLVEFIDQVQLDRDSEEYEAMAHYTQLDREHAASFFDVAQYRHENSIRRTILVPDDLPRDDENTPELIINE